MKIKQHIPNAITCCNLLCGCFSIVKAFEGQLILTSYLVGLAAILDFFDGFLARLLKVSSPIGKDLDSLADMVTFGLAPGVMMYQLLLRVIEIDHIENKSLALVSFLIPIFSAIRLAKFNNDTRQTSCFIGLPTPAVAIFICSIPLVIIQHKTESIFMNIPTLLSIVFIFSFLLISEIPLFALKFKNFSWKDNRVRYVFLLFSFTLIITLHFLSIPLIIVLYVFTGLLTYLYTKRKLV
ncbi:MAG: CDP-alcohol phosphatidyltransferase family protein [Bacteroidota bacterium]